MKTKWIVIGILVFIAIILLGSGAAPLIFSEIVYGCNLQKTLAFDEGVHVKEHKITQQYIEKYESKSSSTSGSRSLEWGYGTVEYSSFFGDFREEWYTVDLKIIVDHCGVPQEFQFQCLDSEGTPWVSLNSKEDNILEYLQNQNCLDGKK